MYLYLTEKGMGTHISLTRCPKQKTDPPKINLAQIIIIKVENVYKKNIYSILTCI